MSARVLSRARAAIGARFRLHGRDPATGLDCAGLAALALDLPVPVRGYALHSGDAAWVAGVLRDLPLRHGIDGPGELVLLRVSAMQLHLAIATETTGIVHADAGLRRVVERPGPLPWPVIGRWRTIEEL